MLQSPGFITCVALLLLIAGAGSAANEQPVAIADAACAASALEYLEDWDSRHEFLASSRPAAGGAVFRSPSRSFGQWVEVRLSNDRITGISRISRDGITRIYFDERCVVSARETSVAPGARQNGDADLTDAKAAGLIAANERGVFYSWSPHMPLSVSGYAEIAAAAESLDIALFAVLSDHANGEFAADEAERSGIPAAALARNRSVELIMRDLNVHAPAILIFSQGEFVSPALPGFRRAADYAALLRRFLDESRAPAN